MKRCLLGWPALYHPPLELLHGDLGWDGGRYTTAGQAHHPWPGEGQRQQPLISIGDVAAFAAAAVDHPDALNKKLILGGPEPLTWRSIVQTFENAIGQSLPVNFVGMGEVIPGLPDIVTPVLTAMETYDSPIPMAETAKTFGVQLTPLSVVVNNMLGIPN